MFSNSPLTISNGKIVDVNVEDIVQEFEIQAEQHRGKGELLFKHYIISLKSEDKDEDGNVIFERESLEPYQWLKMTNEYMEALCYDKNETK